MRITHLIYDDLGNPWLSGGGALRAREIYRRLATRHQITLICGAYPGAPREEVIDGIRILRIGSDRSYALSRLSYALLAVRALRRQVSDVWVHEFSAFAPLFPSARQRRAGVLFFYHFLGFHAVRKHPVAGWVSWLAERWVLGAYQRILTISPSVTDLVTARRPDARVQCVYTGVDAAYFDLDPDEADYILYFGRTDIHTKGLDTLLQAFAGLADDHPGLRLIFAGRGSAEQQARLAQMVQEAGLQDRVEVLGGVDEARKSELLRRALLVAMPSRYEGWGIAAIEAAAAARPLVGTRIPGLVDAVRDGETGVLVEAGDAAALRTAMHQLLTDAPRRHKLGAAGRQWARRFDWEQIARDQEQFLLDSGPNLTGTDRE